MVHICGWQTQFNTNTMQCRQYIIAHNTTTSTYITTIFLCAHMYQNTNIHHTTPSFNACNRLILARYDEDLECAYAPDRLNFGLHVRMGDRRAFQEGTLEYFELLEGFMDTVSTEVVNKGLQPPLFHIFSETLVPCPSLDTGLFDEFPAWPVDLDEVRIYCFLLLANCCVCHRTLCSVRFNVDHP